MISFPIKLFNRAMNLEDTIQVTGSMLISEIRAKAGDLFQDPDSEWLLHWHGTELEDSNTLHAVGVQPGDTILVNSRKTDGRSTAPAEIVTDTTLIIHTSMQTITMRVKFTDTVGSVLAKLDHLKAPGNRLDLALDDRTLEAAETIRELNLEDRASLQLKGKLKGGVYC